MATLDELCRLPLEERVQLVQDLWDSISKELHQEALTEEQKQELDRRLDAMEINPRAGILWDELKKSLMSGL